MPQAIRFYEAAAEGTSFAEQPVKHSALVSLGHHYARSEPRRAERYLKSLMQHKEMIGVRDKEYEKAAQLLNSLTSAPPATETGSDGER
jgi:hypothetical protein